MSSSNTAILALVALLLFVGVLVLQIMEMNSYASLWPM
jgi:hypothetical protein